MVVLEGQLSIVADLNNSESYPGTVQVKSLKHNLQVPEELTET